MKVDFQFEFPLTNKVIYFENATLGLCPKSTIKIINKYIKERCDWMLGSNDWIKDKYKWLEQVDGSKELFSKIIGSKKDEVAFIPNTTTGLNTILSAIPKSGENIVTTDLAYIMGASVCLKQCERGVETKFIKSTMGQVDISDFEKTVDDKTSVIYVDQAAAYNGLVYNLKELSRIAHEHDSFLLIDGIQSVGALDLDVRKEGIDFLATGTYKWLLGGNFNAGYLFINEKHIDTFQSVFIGRPTIDENQFERKIYDKSKLKYRIGIDRFQIYGINELAYVSIYNSMKFLLNYGIKNIDRQIKKLVSLLIDGLLESGFKLQTPVEDEKRLFINVKVKNNKELATKLCKNNIIVGAYKGGIRISPNFYNRPEEINFFLDKFTCAQ